MCVKSHRYLTRVNQHHIIVAMSIKPLFVRCHVSCLVFKRKMFQNHKVWFYWATRLVLHRMYSACDAAKFEWNPLDHTDPNSLNIGEEYAIMILNRPIEIPEKLMIKLWNNAKLRIAVDKGTKRWLKYCEQLEKCASDRGNFGASGGREEILSADLVSGDFDSIDSPTLAHMRSLGCEIHETHDQSKTDFRKAIDLLLAKRIKMNSILVVAEHSGRLDHTISNLNVHATTEKVLSAQNVCMYHLSSDSLTWLLRPGDHVIRIPKRLRDCSAWCSLLPIGASCHVTSTGLKYNMNNSLLEFGGLVSSSNTYDPQEDSVSLTVDDRIFWSMGLGFEED